MFRLAYRGGVTTGIVAPLTRGFVSGINAAFSTGARHKLGRGALVSGAGAVHVTVHPGGSASVSTQLAALRHLLLSDAGGDMGVWLERVRAVRIETSPHLLHRDIRRFIVLNFAVIRGRRRS